MKIVLTGARGIVGGVIHRAFQTAGHEITCLGRDTGYRLGDSPDLRGHEALVHCAFAHLPGRYRGGEGDDPAAFVAQNLDGSIRLFDRAAQDGVRRIIFLSSRAVHDGYPPGTILSDDLPARPTSLYGEVKAKAEDHLASLTKTGLAATSLRATGVYGPGRANKWRDLLDAFLSGTTPSPHVATEVHGADVGAAVLTLLAADKPPLTANLSDLVLDRRYLLTLVAEATGCTTPLPVSADASALRVQRCDILPALGWKPGGLSRLRAEIPRLLDPSGQM